MKTNIKKMIRELAEYSYGVGYTFERSSSEQADKDFEAMMFRCDLVAREIYRLLREARKP